MKSPRCCNTLSGYKFATKSVLGQKALAIHTTLQPRRILQLRLAHSKARSGSFSQSSSLETLIDEENEENNKNLPSTSAPTVGPEVSNIVPANALSSRDVVEVEEAASRASPWGRRMAMLGAILTFAGPALSIPLGDPLMSLVDTVCIGQYATTLELAALGPNTLIFQFATYCTGALATACTCLMSETLELKKRERASSILSTCLAVGLLVGTAQTLILLAAGRNMIAATGCAQQLVTPAWQYLQIRAFSAPSVLMMMVAQAGLLAQKDSWTPCLGVLAQLILNCSGDILLVKYMGMGLVGAAWATLISQWAGCLVTLWCLPRGSRVAAKLSCTWSDIKQLSETFGPATLILLCKNFVYAAVTGTASALAPLQAAAHQPLYGVWNLGGFTHVPLEQAALAFLPPARARRQARETVGLLLGLALAVGAVTSLLTAGVPSLMPQLFSSDASLFPLIRSVAPQAMLSIFLCSLDVASGGVLVASKDLGFLVKVMAAALCLVLGTLGQVRSRGWGLAGIWWTLVLFFAFRAACSLSRILAVANTRGSYLHPAMQDSGELQLKMS